MQAIGMLLSILILGGYYFSQNQQSIIETQNYATVDSLTSSMAIYSEYASSYAKNNPTYSGQPNANLLSLPSWYIVPQNIGSYITSGTSYTYYSNPVSGMVAGLYEKTLSQNVGTVKAGVLYHPVGGNTGLSLPAQIPNGSLVFIR